MEYKFFKIWKHVFGFEPFSNTELALQSGAEKLWSMEKMLGSLIFGWAVLCLLF